MLLSTAVDTHSLEIVKLVIPTNTPTKESFLQDPITNHQLVGTVSYECVHIYYFLCKYNNNPSFAGNLDACLFQIQRLPPFFQHLPLFHHHRQLCSIIWLITLYRGSFIGFSWGFVSIPFAPLNPSQSLFAQERYLIDMYHHVTIKSS